MDIAKKYEDVVAERDAALAREAEVGRLYDSLVNRSNRERDASEKREAALREELESIKASVDGYDSPEHAAQVADEMGYQCEALQQRLTVAERRESEAREEILELSRKLDVFYSRTHGIKNLSEIEKANDEAKNLKLKVRKYEVLLNISKELLTTISRHGATTKTVDWCDSFKADVAGRIEKIGAALKPAAETDHICEGCGSKGWTANCAQCVPY